MKQSRLTTLLEETPELLPASGTVLVLGPRAASDLSALPMDRVRAVQGFRPDHDALAAQGYKVTPEPEGNDHTAALVILPRSRAEGRAMVAEAAARVRPGAPVWIDGQKTDGIDTMLRDLRGRAGVAASLVKAHGRIFAFAGGDAAPFADWQAQPLTPAEGFRTMPGVFSAEAVDRGSQLLAAALPAELKGRVADLGAGWGWLSAQVLARPGVKSLDLVEADHLALACARANVTDPRAAFHWADATSFKPERILDVVVMNPPFHQGRAADPALGAGFIAAAARMLSPAGVLWMVANRHLPYEAALSGAFREVAELQGDGGFKLFRASHPQRAAASGAAISPQRGVARRRR